MTRSIAVNDLHHTLRETVRWAVADLGWLVVDAWEDETWGDLPGGVDHCVALCNGRNASVFLLAAGLGEHVAVAGGLKVREDGRIVERRRLDTLAEIAVGLLEHGRIDLRTAS